MSDNEVEAKSSSKSLLPPELKNSNVSIQNFHYKSVINNQNGIKEENNSSHVNKNNETLKGWQKYKAELNELWPKIKQISIWIGGISIAIGTILNFIPEKYRLKIRKIMSENLVKIFSDNVPRAVVFSFCYLWLFNRWKNMNNSIGSAKIFDLSVKGVIDWISMVILFTKWYLHNKENKTVQNALNWAPIVFLYYLWSKSNQETQVKKIIKGTIEEMKNNNNNGNN